MANKGIVTWTVSPGVTYVITYKKGTDIIWTNPPGNTTTSSPFIIDADFDTNVTYDFKIDSSCGTITFQGTPNCPSVINLVANNV